MTNLQIIQSSILIDTMKGNTEVQLRKTTDGYYMMSPTTGVHFIYEKYFNDRVQAHWDGFKANQERGFHKIISDNF